MAGNSTGGMQTQVFSTVTCLLHPTVKGRMGADLEDLLSMVEDRAQVLISFKKRNYSVTGTLGQVEAARTIIADRLAALGDISLGGQQGDLVSPSPAFASLQAPSQQDVFQKAAGTLHPTIKASMADDLEQFLSLVEEQAHVDIGYSQGQYAVKGTFEQIINAQTVITQHLAYLFHQQTPPVEERKAAFVTSTQPPVRPKPIVQYTSTTPKQAGRNAPDRPAAFTAEDSECPSSQDTSSLIMADTTGKLHQQKVLIGRESSAFSPIAQQQQQWGPKSTTSSQVAPSSHVVDDQGVVHHHQGLPHHHQHASLHSQGAGFRSRDVSQEKPAERDRKSAFTPVTGKQQHSSRYSSFSPDATHDHSPVQVPKKTATEGSSVGSGSAAGNQPHTVRKPEEPRQLPVDHKQHNERPKQPQDERLQQSQKERPEQHGQNPRKPALTRQQPQGFRYQQKAHLSESETQYPAQDVPPGEARKPVQSRDPFQRGSTQRNVEWTASPQRSHSPELAELLKPAPVIPEKVVGLNPTSESPPPIWTTPKALDLHQEGAVARGTFWDESGNLRPAGANSSSKTSIPIRTGHHVVPDSPSMSADSRSTTMDSLAATSPTADSRAEELEVSVYNKAVPFDEELESSSAQQLPIEEVHLETDIWLYMCKQRIKELRDIRTEHNISITSQENGAKTTVTIQANDADGSAKSARQQFVKLQQEAQNVVCIEIVSVPKQLSFQQSQATMQKVQMMYPQVLVLNGRRPGKVMFIGDDKVTQAKAQWQKLLQIQTGARGHGQTDPLKPLRLSDFHGHQTSEHKSSDRAHSGGELVLVPGQTKDRPHLSYQVAGPGRQGSDQHQGENRPAGIKKATDKVERAQHRVRVHHEPSEDPGKAQSGKPTRMSRLVETEESCYRASLHIQLVEKGTRTESTKASTRAETSTDHGHLHTTVKPSKETSEESKVAHDSHLGLAKTAITTKAPQESTEDAHIVETVHDSNPLSKATEKTTKASRKPTDQESRPAANPLDSAAGLKLMESKDTADVAKGAAEKSRPTEKAGDSVGLNDDVWPRVIGVGPSDVVGSLPSDDGRSRASDVVGPTAKKAVVPRPSDDVRSRTSDDVGPRPSDDVRSRTSDDVGPRPSDVVGPAAKEAVGPSASDAVRLRASDVVGPSDDVRPRARDVVRPPASDDLSEKEKLIRDLIEDGGAENIKLVYELLDPQEDHRGRPGGHDLVDRAMKELRALERCHTEGHGNLNRNLTGLNEIADEMLDELRERHPDEVAMLEPLQQLQRLRHAMLGQMDSSPSPPLRIASHIASPIILKSGANVIKRDKIFSMDDEDSGPLSKIIEGRRKKLAERREDPIPEVSSDIDIDEDDNEELEERRIRGKLLKDYPDVKKPYTE